MIVEQRVYSVVPGKVRTFLDLVEGEGLAIQRPYIGVPLGYFLSESGILNQVIHLWGFENAGDREARRARLAADERWVAFVPKVLPLLERMESRILVPTSFSAIGGRPAS